MSILAGLGALTGVLGAVALILTAVFNRSSSKASQSTANRSLGLEELEAALAAQKVRIDDLSTRLGVAERGIRECEQREAKVRSDYNALLIAVAKERG